MKALLSLLLLTAAFALGYFTRQLQQERMRESRRTAVARVFKEKIPVGDDFDRVSASLKSEMGLELRFDRERGNYYALRSFDSDYEIYLVVEVDGSRKIRQVRILDPEPL